MGWHIRAIIGKEVLLHILTRPCSTVCDLSVFFKHAANKLQGLVATHVEDTLRTGNKKFEMETRATARKFYERSTRRPVYTTTEPFQVLRSALTATPPARYIKRNMEIRFRHSIKIATSASSDHDATSWSGSLIPAWTCPQTQRI